MSDICAKHYHKGKLQEKRIHLRISEISNNLRNFYDILMVKSCEKLKINTNFRVDLKRVHKKKLNNTS